MNSLALKYNHSINTASPLFEGLERIVNYDQDGNEVISFAVSNVKLNFGKVVNFSLDSMIKAGINPDSMRVNTSSVSRVDSLDKFDELSQIAEKVFNDINPDNKTE